MLWTLVFPMFHTLRPAAPARSLKRRKFSSVACSPPLKVFTYSTPSCCANLRSSSEGSLGIWSEILTPGASSGKRDLELGAGVAHPLAAAAAPSATLTNVLLETPGFPIALPSTFYYGG